MSNSLLVEYYNQIPEGRSETKPKMTRKEAIEVFKHRVADRYNEGTLNAPSWSTAITALAVPPCSPLACSAPWTPARPSPPVFTMRTAKSPRRRPIRCGLYGSAATARPTMMSYSAWLGLARSSEGFGRPQRARLPPAEFAEAYNQRTIVHFRLKQFERCVADCERALELNPHHFGAQAGLGQCYLQMRKHRAALKAFRHALRINPHMDGVAETIRTLENALGEEGRRDDKK